MCTYTVELRGHFCSNTSVVYIFKALRHDERSKCLTDVGWLLCAYNTSDTCGRSDTARQRDIYLCSQHTMFYFSLYALSPRLQQPPPSNTFTSQRFPHSLPSPFTPFTTPFHLQVHISKVTYPQEQLLPANTILHALPFAKYAVQHSVRIHRSDVHKVPFTFLTSNKLLKFPRTKTSRMLFRWPFLFDAHDFKFNSVWFNSTHFNWLGLWDAASNVSTFFGCRLLLKHVNNVWYAQQYKYHRAYNIWSPWTYFDLLQLQNWRDIFMKCWL